MDEKKSKYITYFFKNYAGIAEKNTYSTYIPERERGFWCLIVDNDMNENFAKIGVEEAVRYFFENNEFEVIDYLNEGKTRSVKTLSGGQAFQVSLSLALALAESVQSEAITKRNFFFIDEGFGTQDLDSVNIVFESITKLLKENRIVGIISHVEELKERIPISLTITKDIERGSLINMS